MRRKKVSLYDSHEKRILEQSSVFAMFLTKRGLLEDESIQDERMRKIRQSTAKKAYHNTEILLGLYRTIVWVLNCVPGDLAEELCVPTRDVDALLHRLDFELSQENRRLEGRLNTVIKTRILLSRVQDALMVLRKKPEDGELLYQLIYDAYLDPIERKTEELVKRLQMSPRTYYRRRAEAISIISIKLWSAPAGEIDDWLELLTMMENM